MQTVSILGVPFSKLSLDETVNELHRRLDRNDPQLFHLITANPEIVMNARKDSELRRIVEQADMITPDGIGIVLASRFKGEPVPERVTGYEMLLRLLALGHEHGWSFYFLGADEETSKKAVDIIMNQYPGLKVAGRRNGFFTADDEPQLVEQIASVKPDLLIVAMGAPRAEKWIFKYKSRLSAKLAMGVGGSLDVIAGKVKRAPVVWQKLNLEWLYRLLRQPSRWRRQLVLPQFAILFLLKGRKS